MLKTDERRSGSIDGKAHRVHHLQQGGADDVVTELLIAALTASAHAIGRGSGNEGACCTCEPQDRLPPLQAPILTNMVVSASMASVRPYVLRAQAASGAPAACCTYCAHHMQGGADDATGLLIAALTASAHAIGRGSEGGCCTCDAVLLQPI